MTREEAIEELSSFSEDVDRGDLFVEVSSSTNEALNMAIQALEQEPFMNKPCVAYQVCHEDKVKVLDKIRTEIEQLPTKTIMNWDGFFNECSKIEYVDVTKNKLLSIIDKHKAESEVE